MKSLKIYIATIMISFVQIIPAFFYESTIVTVADAYIEEKTCQNFRVVY